jgi:hypothetical protein
LVKAARDGRNQIQTWRRSRVGLRGSMLYVLAAPLALAAVISLAKGNLSAALAAGAAFGLMGAGASLTRRGILEELVAPERRFTRSWSVPHKYLAVLSVSFATMLAAYGAVDHDGLVSTTFGLLAFLGFHLTYRLPRPGVAFPARRTGGRDKNLHKALVQAELKILAIEKAALRIGNPELGQRLHRIAGQGRAVLEQIAERPDERFRSRRFLNLYLDGAERVASRYARTHRLARGGELEQNFRNVLVEIERVFARQLERQADQDAFDLDVQIEVLRRQLESEGIT